MFGSEGTYDFRMIFGVTAVDSLTVVRRRATGTGRYVGWGADIDAGANGWQGCAEGGSEEEELHGADVIVCRVDLDNSVWML